MLREIFPESSRGGGGGGSSSERGSVLTVRVHQKEVNKKFE